MKKSLLLFVAACSALAVSAQSPRMVLYEEFTGENCGPCAATNPGLNALLKQTINQGRVAAIKWEVPIPSAPSKSWSLYQTNKAEIDWRYRSVSGGGYGYISQSTSSSSHNGPNGGINSAPSGRIDGQHQWQFGASSDHPGNLNNTALGNAAAIPAPFTITMARAWGPGGASIDVTVSIVATANFNAVGNLRFRTVMVERKVEFATPPGTTNEKEFHDVGIKSFPNLQTGTPMASTWTSGQTFSFTMNCPIPSYARKKTEIAFVGFIQDDGDKKVHQAYRLEKEALPEDAAAVSAKVEPVCSATFAPTVVVKNMGLNALTNLSITPYINGTPANVTQWVGNIPTNGTTAIVLDPISNSAAAGVNTFSFAITGTNGTDLEALNNGADTKFLVVTNYQSTPVVEGFAGTFPPPMWAVIGTSGSAPWVKSTAAGAYNLSPESTMLPLYTNPNPGDVQELILPPVDLSGPGAPKLDFVYAYAQTNANSTDKLDVFVSSDCGTTWTNVFSRSGSILASALSYEPAAFIPDPWEWRAEGLTLTGFNMPNVLVKFVGTDGNGNNIFLDDINLRQETVTGLADGGAKAFNCAVYPNPAQGPVTIAITSPEAAQAEIMITNTLGQVVRAMTVKVGAGSNNVSIDLSDVAAGVYTALIKAGNNSSTTKFTITH